MSPFRDLGGVAQLMRVAFQSEIGPGTLPMLWDWALAERLGPFLGVFASLGLSAPEQMLGFVWEESGQIVGNVTIGPSDQQSGAWLMSNVAVHPEYRRRGIARSLVETAIQAVRRRGGRYLLLQVEASNLGARQLYETAGFRSLEQIGEFLGTNLAAHSTPARGGSLVPATRTQWSAIRSLVAEHLPPALRAYRYTLSGRFASAHLESLRGRLSSLAAAVQQSSWCLLDEDRVCGGMVVRAHIGWGTHRVAVAVASAYHGRAEDLLIDRAARILHGRASRRVAFVVSAGHGAMAERLRQRGLRESRTLHLMALDLF